MKSKKIVSLEYLAKKIKAARDEHRKVVHCHGCFDLLHIGHIRYLEQARGMGDLLVVTVTPDRFVDKGPDRPAFGEKLRAEALSSLQGVDFVAINQWPTAVETLKLLRPCVYVKGADFKRVSDDKTGRLQAEADVCRELGIELKFTEDVVFSSSNLINRFLSAFPEELEEYLKLFRNRYSTDQVFEYIEKMSELDVLLLGDTIIDEYCYCSPLGTSSKYPMLAMLKENCETFAGGVLAIANHLSSFVNSVSLLSVLGEQSSHEEFIKKSVDEKVNFNFFTQTGAPTTLKRRFIESYTLTKIFEIYEMNDFGLDLGAKKAFCERLKELLPSSSMVIVADFGHGAVSAPAREAICSSDVFLAVNAQMNAGNKMFNTISKYSRADYISISEGELRLDLKTKKQPVSVITAESVKRFGSKFFVTTLGKKGACIASSDGSFVEVPAFVVKAVDTIGSGDAFFAISSLAVRAGAPAEVAVFLGNIAGAISVQTLGNQNNINRDSVGKYITAILK